MSYAVARRGDRIEQARIRSGRSLKSGVREDAVENHERGGERRQVREQRVLHGFRPEFPSTNWDPIGLV